MPVDKPYTVVKVEDLLDNQLVSVNSQRKFINEIKGAIQYFFSKEDNTFRDHYPDRVDTANFPFKGFILHGKPGTGKTEAVRMAFKGLHKVLENEGLDLRLFHINPADINRGKVGEIEQRMRKVFEAAKENAKRQRTIVLFDDIETLIIERTDSNSTEWSRAANGVFFHEVDRLPTSRVLVIATTNEPGMVDKAIRSRLSMRKMEPPSHEEMLTVAEAALPRSAPNLPSRKALMETVEKRIKESDEPPSFRLARKSVIEVLMSEVVGWR